MPLVELGSAPGPGHTGGAILVAPGVPFDQQGGACMNYEQHGRSGSESSTGIPGRRSRSRNRTRRLQQVARLIASDRTLREVGFEISASSLVRRSEQKVDGCTCTPYYAASSEKVRGAVRLMRLEIHAPWCRGKRRGAGGSSDTDALSSSCSIEQGELWPTSANTSPRVSVTSTSGG